MPDIYSFESAELKVPSSFTAERGVELSVSTDQQVHGKQSLKLTWDGSGGLVRIVRPVDARNKTIKQRLYAAVFNLWIYQSAGGNQESLRFEFGRNDKPDCWFDYQLNFAGWRTVMMPYNRMAGKEHPAMDWIQIRAPKGKSGTAYIDLLFPDVQFDRRHASSDTSYSFSRDDKLSRVRPGKPRDLYHAGIRDVPNSPIDAQKKAAIVSLEKHLEKNLLVNAPKPNMARLREKFQKYQLNKTSGRHVFFLHTADIYQGSSLEKDITPELKFDLKDAGSLMLKLAKAWHVSIGKDKEELEAMIVSMNLLLLKSGWHEGHGQGTLHHFGYSSRGYYTAGFLTRELLEKHGLRNRVARAMQWFNHSHYCFDPYSTTHYANLDYFNTMALAQLQALLTTKSIAERYHAVRQWSGMFSAVIANNRHGNNGGFKEDGSAFHHWGHYPAYEAGAVAAIGPLFHLLSETPFRLSPDAYHSFRRALLALRFQSNKYDLPRSLCGRHPYNFEDNLEKLGEAYIAFAKAGTPDGKQDVDQEMAAVALRLFPDARKHFSQEIQAEPDPDGHQTFPYAHASAHRRGGWLALARGHSRYVWGSEIYGTVNQYGRYQSHGTLEILPPGGLTASGVWDRGWDWSRPPGATVTHLPLERIPFESIIMMPTTNETFVGHCHMNHEDGLFAMVLKEKKEPGRPNIGLHAQKSYHFFDDVIVCLGSSISNPGSKLPVETILFQQHLETPDRPLMANGESIGTFPFLKKITTPTILRDVVGHFYRVPGGQNLNIARQHQHSYYHYAKIKNDKGEIKNRDGQNAPTEADYAVAWLNHGTHTKAASYHYAILVSPEKKRAAAWQKSPGYQLLRHDDIAHVAQSNRTTSYAIFKAGEIGAVPPEGEPVPAVFSVSEPCLIMTKREENRLHLNLTDPDLRMPGNEGGMLAGEIFVPTGNGPEVSTINVTLHGHYSLAQGEGVVLQRKGNQTLLTFNTLRGRTIPCVLKQM